MSFEARFPGRCAACEERIAPGEQVRYSEDDELAHNRCEESNESHAAPIVVCDRCWLTKPCDCE